MKNKHRFTLALLCFAIQVLGQSHVTDFGVEIQAYPTGLIPGIRFERSFSEKDLFTLRLGFQIIDHRDLGIQDDETGTGYGATVGYKHYFRPGFKGLNLGLRLDTWSNTIDWTNNIPNGFETGRSSVWVLQPTAELGWGIVLGENAVVTPALAFGYEVNVKTDGKETGQGAIILLGITLAYRLK
ncbi:MAG: hypothetical protein MUC59_12150 [Saprospiraceae bacterium]|nr:hypothetical protein [Saprospiraceae bacterium]